MKYILKKILSIFSFLLFDPFAKLRQYRAIPYFISNFFAYTKANASVNNKFKPSFKNWYVTTYDRFEQAGANRGHYFFQDIWAAQYLNSIGVKNHVDVGSRIDGFIAHTVPFAEVEYVDIRPFDCAIPNFKFKQGSILQMPYETNSVTSLSCLHVIEHIGLGRYGDPINPLGYQQAAEELERVLAIDGTLLFSTPVGKERLCFDAHRVFNPYTVVNEMFKNLELISFSLITDKGDGITHNATMQQAQDCNYGCGLFVFTKK